MKTDRRTPQEPESPPTHKMTMTDFAPSADLFMYATSTEVCVSAPVTTGKRSSPWVGTPTFEADKIVYQSLPGVGEGEINAWLKRKWTEPHWRWCGAPKDGGVEMWVFRSHCGNCPDREKCLDCGVTTCAGEDRAGDWLCQDCCEERDQDCDCGQNEGDAHHCAECDVKMCDGCWNDLCENKDEEPLCDVCYKNLQQCAWCLETSHKGEDHEDGWVCAECLTAHREEEEEDEEDDE